MVCGYDGDVGCCKLDRGIIGVSNIIDRGCLNRTKVFAKIINDHLQFKHLNFICA